MSYIYHLARYPIIPVSYQVFYTSLKIIPQGLEMSNIIFNTKKDIVHTKFIESLDRFA